MVLDYDNFQARRDSAYRGDCSSCDLCSSVEWCYRSCSDVLLFGGCWINSVGYTCNILYAPRAKHQKSMSPSLYVFVYL